MTEKIILVSPFPEFIPVLKGVYAQDHETRFLTLSADFKRILGDLDLPSAFIGEGIPPQVRELANHTAAGMLSYISSLHHTDTRLNDGVLEWLNTRYAGYLYPRLGELVMLALAVDAAHPTLCIVHNDVEPLLRMVAQWARGVGVPCLHIPHAIYIDGFERTSLGTDIHDIVTASHIVTAGPYQDNWYTARGGCTHPIGLPQHDKWATMRVDTSRARRRLGLDSYRPVAMFLSSWRQDTNMLGQTDGLNEAYTALLQVMKLLPDIQFIVKLHRSGNNGDWHVKLAQEANATCLITQMHLDECMQAADAILSYGPSGAVIEGAHLPHLRLLSIGGFQDDPEVITTDYTTVGMVEALTKALSADPINTKAFQYKYAGVPDGLHTERAIALVRQLCQVS
jgi:hypothetical protein